MAWGSHYEVLGVARSADRDIIRAAYRVLAKRYHPDTTTGPKDKAAARFCKLQDAYEVLSDARRRAEYDAQLDAAAREPQAPQAPRPTQEPPRTPEPEPQSHRAAPERKSPPKTETGAGAWLTAGAFIIIVVVLITVIEIIGGFEAPQLLSRIGTGFYS